MTAKMAAQAVAEVERNLGKRLRHGINLQKGTNLKRCCEDKECGEIFDRTHVLSLLTQCSFKYYTPYVWLGWNILRHNLYTFKH